MDGKHPDQDAQEILANYWAKSGGPVTIPVDPIAIAHKLGIQVFTAQLGNDVSGMLHMKAGYEPEIYLSASDNYNRQRFTCAHEIGHWSKRVAEGVLEGQHVDHRDQLAAQGTDPDEIYANQFAANLLMPAEEVRRLHVKGYGAASIANKLRVSVEAATLRLKNLRLV